ncbi:MULTISPECIES: Sec-independent protein translocase subunit TatA [unclassified Arthrobacter]|uniref:Sec-independent protein translocase subunit TatA n=1 Tax=unclassified Arthrobacter TaxID=235627 RepID=UPI00159D1D29|nr:Sec-independent protein translocase subunit TatA [Arthrobacter sp. STN4]MCQ9165798.1 Sec-independent protein translocase subunit TatA [Arthrobacter sp. STN4]NVM98017.1 Sec-independent protein translocase subunit TatA [Arthrobacter sp. SDTb3-6]
MGRIFENPAVVIVLIIVVVLLFAAPKLPGMARSLGQSMRIIKSEVKEMKNDGKEEKPAPAPAPEAPVEGKIVNNPTQPGSTSGTGTGTGTGAQS